MQGLQPYFKSKPLILIVIPLVYILLVGLVRWWLSPPVAALLYVAGGVIGVFLLDAAEAFFNVHPSPFRSVVFAAGFVVVSVFVVTSSANLMAVGLVLSLYLSMILMLLGELHLRGNLDSWFRLVATPVSRGTQIRLLYIFSGIFVLLTVLASGVF